MSLLKVSGHCDEIFLSSVLGNSTIDERHGARCSLEERR